MSEYHYAVKITLGCGCSMEKRLQLREGFEPSGEAAFLALVDTLEDGVVQSVMTEHTHEAKGEESYTIKVGPKVGPVPFPAEGGDQWNL